MSKPQLEQLLAIFDQAYNRRSWHGTNLRGSLRRVTAEQAAWRPAPERHNIWEIVVHAAYWKYAVRRHLTGEGRGSFPLKGSNWFHRPEDVGVPVVMEPNLSLAATSALLTVLAANLEVFVIAF